MKLIYTNVATLNSKGLYFVQGKEYEVDDKVGEYLLKHFGPSFKKVDEPKKAEPKATRGRKAASKSEG